MDDNDNHDGWAGLQAILAEARAMKPDQIIACPFDSEQLDHVAGRYHCRFCGAHDKQIRAAS